MKKLRRLYHEVDKREKPHNEEMWSKVYSIGRICGHEMMGYLQWMEPFRSIIIIIEVENEYKLK